ncbi:MAG: outer membrane protein [Hyphomicrobiaceae bacterium]
MVVVTPARVREPMLPIYVDRKQPTGPSLSWASRLGIGAIACLALALGSLRPANAQNQAPFPGWRGYNDTPPPADSIQGYHREDNTRPFDGSQRGTFRAPRRDQYETDQPAYYIPPAADYATPANPHHWRGLYAGGHLGGAFGDVIGKGATPGEADLSGFMTGGYIGYDLALGNIVAGVELDAIWSLGEGSESAFGTGRLAPNIDWLTSARARLGYAWNQILVYTTAGVAYSNIDYNVTINGVNVDKSQSQTGFVIGGGLDFELTSQMSVRIEALHYNFGGTDFTAANTHFETDADLTTLRAGLTVRF